MISGANNWLWLLDYGQTSSSPHLSIDHIIRLSGRLIRNMVWSGRSYKCSTDRQDNMLSRLLKSPDTSCCYCLPRAFWPQILTPLLVVFLSDHSYRKYGELQTPPLLQWYDTLGAGILPLGALTIDTTCWYWYCSLGILFSYPCWCYSIYCSYGALTAYTTCSEALTADTTCWYCSLGGSDCSYYRHLLVLFPMGLWPHIPPAGIVP